MKSFHNSNGGVIVEDLIRTIQENKAYLSELDGEIGDGDHGINMSKGFRMAGERLEGESEGFSGSLKVLGSVLLMEIGGSMGPLYGTFFKKMARAAKDADEIDGGLFGDMLADAYDGVKTLGNADVGDKTLLDTLHQALEAYQKAIADGGTFDEALSTLAETAERGKESTRDMVAKVGRASRLGERSRGHLDAGATSCWIILDSMAGSIQRLLAQG
jgi:dihydroxyacetone kinase-like protein